MTANRQRGRAEDQKKPDKEIVRGVEEAPIVEFADDLCNTKLFADCVNDLKEKSLRNKHAFVLTYRLGDPIIRLNEHPQLSFLLPNGEPFSKHFQLKSNPLFVVLDGNVEVHRSWQINDRKKNEVSVPLVVFSSGDAFGEFELELHNPRPAWQSYVAEATAGWRTVECLGTKFSDRQCWRVATQTDFSDPIDREDCGVLLRESFRALVYERDCSSPYQIKIMVVPRYVIDDLARNSPMFVRNLYDVLASHARTNIALSATEGRALVTRESIASHFVNITIPRCLSGEMPVLVPCTQLQALIPWWKVLHHELFTHQKQLNSANLPYLFYVPAMKGHSGSSRKSPLAQICPSPVLTSAMIRVYTRDLALGPKKPSLDRETFLSRLGREARPNNKTVLEKYNGLSMGERMKVLAEALGLSEEDTRALIQCGEKQKPIELSIGDGCFSFLPRRSLQLPDFFFFKRPRSNA